MQPVQCELLRLALPLKRRFGHAKADRTTVDTVLIAVRDDLGNTGWGEILARPYVSGEHHDDIFERTGPALAKLVLARTFGTADDLVGFLGDLDRAGDYGPAVRTGFDLALVNLAEQTVGFDFAALYGPRRATAPTRCVTVGFETPLEALPQRVRMARLTGAAVVKLKVGRSDDELRIRSVAEVAGDRLALRLDANGEFSFDQAATLLDRISDVPVSSLEQPFAKDAPDLTAQLAALHAQSAVPLVADESVCTADDARSWADRGGYQIYNVRVGKCGGFIGSSIVLKVASERGIGLVAGSMVGETGILNRASEALLQFNEGLRYVEGLGQNKWLLELDPVDRCPDSGAGWTEDWDGRAVFQYRRDAAVEFETARRVVDR